MFRLLTLADKVLVFVLACVVAVSVSLVSALTHQGTSVVVEVQGSPVYRLDLREERSVEIRGVQGVLHVQVRDGKVAVIDADCPNHVCVRTGWRSRAGEVIVCVPNKTIVRILKEEQKGVDAVTG